MVLTLIISVLLVIMAFYDFKFRYIPVYLFVMAGIPAVWSVYNSNYLKDALSFTVINFSIVLVLMSLLTLYYWVKTRTFSLIFDKALGWGDVVFLCLLCLLFSPVWFVFVLTGSLVISLIISLVTQVRKQTEIPLAGWMITVVVPILVIFEIKGISRYSDTCILQWLNKIW